LVLARMNAGDCDHPPFVSRCAPPCRRSPSRRTSWWMRRDRGRPPDPALRRLRSTPPSCSPTQRAGTTAARKMPTPSPRIAPASPIIALKRIRGGPGPGRPRARPVGHVSKRSVPGPPTSSARHRPHHPGRRAGRFVTIGRSERDAVRAPAESRMLIELIALSASLAASRGWPMRRRGCAAIEGPIPRVQGERSAIPAANRRHARVRSAPFCVVILRTAARCRIEPHGARQLRPSSSTTRCSRPASSDGDVENNVSTGRRRKARLPRRLRGRGSRHRQSSWRRSAGGASPANLRRIPGRVHPDHDNPSRPRSATLAIAGCGGDPDRRCPTGPHLGLDKMPST
jgi:hypothetical protein